MLYPPYPTPAPRHNQPLFSPFNWVYTAIFNVLELPVTAAPLGLNERGLPLGVQIAATHGNDHLTLAVALELERAFGGWVPLVGGGQSGNPPGSEGSCSMGASPRDPSPLPAMIGLSLLGLAVRRRRSR
jgi:MYXO-CTERM domain-containing protein